MTAPEKARTPEDLARLWFEHATARDADGLASLYEAAAVLELPGGELAGGRAAIRAYYAGFLASEPALVRGRTRKAVRKGNLALTSTRLEGGTVSAEVARRQPDGAWLWVLDAPDLTTG
ncbi:YybH family protein [Phytomonospora endophytica]|uniref:Ketosteroid isomerase-like protein n=1 Tax=Phytomonospora endophytica TaxID=714109 RepID=A0A841FQ85_9ACTN|nr:nuclear transport factor 2 family protein [Phytomonospora endophytica]MBB6036993.1 ketosteroid isomerase-like protein [Phytomonospora endophytica]GIG69463.1 hypothetical protein Pen01_57580 [Phytomonospora endophytica]